MKRTLEHPTEENFRSDEWKRKRLEIIEDLENTLVPRKKLKKVELYFIMNVVRIFLKDDLTKFIMVLLVDVERKERNDWCLKSHIKIWSRLRDPRFPTYVQCPECYKIFETAKY